MGISILEKQEDETDIIMKEYFHKIEDIEEQHKEKSIVYNQNKKKDTSVFREMRYGVKWVIRLLAGQAMGLITGNNAKPPGLP